MLRPSSFHSQSTHRSCARAPSRACTSAGSHCQIRMAAGRNIIALDFDGVVCDSVGESCLSGIKAAARKWPEIFDTPEAKAREPELAAQMRIVRPVVETGYENVVQIRCLYDGMDPQHMLEHWDVDLPAAMEKWKLDRAELVTLFGTVRDEWIASDLDGWLAPNKIYAGIAEPIRQALKEHELYIVTTKQAHFTDLLLRKMADLPVPTEHIFSQTVSGRPKSEVLTALASRHPQAPRKIFVEDKLSTLEKVSKVSELDDWELYLVDWGYNTLKERERAAANPRITLLDSAKFSALLAGSS